MPNATNQLLPARWSSRSAPCPESKSVGAVSRLPLAGGNSSRSFNVLGEQPGAMNADLRVSTPDYFPTMGIPLLAKDGTSAHTTAQTLSRSRSSIRRQPRLFSRVGIRLGRYLTNFGPTGIRSCKSSAWSATCGMSRWRRRRDRRFICRSRRRSGRRCLSRCGARLRIHSTFIPAVQERGLEHRPQRSAGESAHDAGRARALRSAPKVRDVAALDLRRAGDTACGDRALRRDLVFGRPTNEGNWDSHGAGRTARRICCEWSCGKAGCSF